MIVNRLGPRSLMPLTSLLYCGCLGGGEQVPLAASVEAVSGGSVYSGHPAVGMVLPGQQAGLCTGTLVGPKTVLTAAHCVHPLLVDTDGTRRLLPCITPRDAWPRYSDCDDERGVLIFRRAHFLVGCATLTSCDIQPGINLFVSAEPPASHPAFELGEVAGDLALIRLSESPPQLPIAVSPEKPALGGRVQLIGYGRSESEQGAAGIKRRGSFTVHDTAAPNASFAIRGDGFLTPRSCPGDSGAPALLTDGHEAVAGVLVGGAKRSCDFESLLATSDVAWLADASAGAALVAEVDSVPPVVSLLSPLDGTSFFARASSALVEVSASIDDRSFTFALVDVDGEPAGQLAPTDSRAQPPHYAISLALSPGYHRLSVVAIDDANNRSSVTVRVEVVADLRDIWGQVSDGPAFVEAYVPSGNEPGATGEWDSGPGGRPAERQDAGRDGANGADLPDGGLPDLSRSVDNVRGDTIAPADASAGGCRVAPHPLPLHLVLLIALFVGRRRTLKLRPDGPDNVALVA